MKRIGSVFLSLAVLVGLAGVLEAQGVEAEDGNTSIEIDGETSTTIFRRDNAMNTVLNGGANTDAQSAMLYHYNLGVTANVGDRVTGRIELENDLLNSASGTGANANDTALIGEGTSFESTQVGEASITADRFLAENLSLTIGIQDYDTDLRGDGNPFFLDLQNSESITGAGRDLNQDAGGAKLTADIGQSGALDLFWFTVRENSAPSVGNDNDEHILGAVFNGSLQDTGSYQVLATYFQDVNGPAGSSVYGVWTIGGGVEYDLSKASNLYGEAYVQGGERGPNVDQDTSIAVDLGYAGEAGPAYYDLSLTHVSGNDPNSQDRGDFLSYEDNDDTMILEENILGLDVDQNYQKLQAVVGFDTTFRRKDDLSVELLAAYAQRAEDSGLQDDSLGIETDLNVTWAHSEALDFELGLARVWSGDHWDLDQGATSDALDLYTVSANLNF